MSITPSIETINGNHLSMKFQNIIIKTIRKSILQAQNHPTKLTTSTTFYILRSSFLHPINIKSKRISVPYQEKWIKIQEKLWLKRSSMKTKENLFQGQVHILKDLKQLSQKQAEMPLSTNSTTLIRSSTFLQNILELDSTI